MPSPPKPLGFCNSNFIGMLPRLLSIKKNKNPSAPINKMAARAKIENPKMPTPPIPQYRVHLNFIGMLPRLPFTKTAKTVML